MVPSPGYTSPQAREDNLPSSSSEDHSGGAAKQPGVDEKIAADRERDGANGSENVSGIIISCTKMSKEVVTKKRKALRTQVTQLICAAELQIQQRADREHLIATQAQIKAIASSLAKANEQMEGLLTDDVDETEFQRVIEYDLNIAAISSKLETYLQEQTQGMMTNPTQAQMVHSASPTMHSAMQDATELLKLPKLELIKFIGNALEWTRFWTQYESAVHMRPNMSNGQKFNYLMSSLTGKAAAAIEGLQFSAENNYEQAIKILKETFGGPELLVDLHMKALLALVKVTSVYQTEALRKLFQKVQVHTLALQSLDVTTECYAPMLMPVLKRAIPSELLIQFKDQEASRNRPITDNEAPTSSMGKKSADALQRIIEFLREQVCLRKEA